MQYDFAQIRNVEVADDSSSIVPPDRSIQLQADDSTRRGTLQLQHLSKIILHQILGRYLTSLLTVQRIADFLRSLEEIGKRIASQNPTNNHLRKIVIPTAILRLLRKNLKKVVVKRILDQ